MPDPVSPRLSLRFAFLRSVWCAVVVVLAAVSVQSCGSSSPIVHPDGGGGASGSDAAVDHPAALDGGGADGGSADESPGDASTDGAREQLGSAGTTCALGGDCASGHCFDGVCCQQDCSATCHSCALPGSVGTCLLADVGTDPHNDCADEGSASCGFDGTCDGSGACRKYPNGVVCKQPSCSGSTLTLAFRCSAGVCSPTSGQPCDPFICGTAASCATTCTRDADCMPPNVCNNGSCGKHPLGGVCAVGDDCNSGICQQGVCCSTTCTGTCRSCALPGSEGACTNVPQRQDPLNQCADTGVASCGTDGSCDGAGACSLYARGTTCRASAGICDVAETCAGAGAPCPADGFLSGVVCRGASPGGCDVAETCSGASATCPPDGFAVAGAVCRQSAGICDVVETCSGASATCPPDGFATGTPCRAAAGICDVAETCGAGPACPPDVFVPQGTPCRGSAGMCDVAESCTGAAAACPPDVLLPQGTVCRGAVDLCDAAESCTGVVAACPPDAVLPAGASCRPSAGMCDLAETCNGTSMACPPDLFVAAGTVCRGSLAACDLAESCTGNAAACPPDLLASAGSVCRGSVGGCDIAESCDGVTVLCPIDGMAPTPTAPINLAAARGNNQATLTWTAVAGATTYNIRRSTVSGGPYTTVGSTAATSFINTGLTNGTMFFFVVSAITVGPGCESANSAEAAVIPSACPGVYCDDFEADTVGTMANGWTRVGGSAGDWLVTAAGTKFFSQVGATSSTFRASFASGALGAPWSGAISISADVELLAAGISGQAALLCPRFVDVSNYYCAALSQTGVQIQTKVGGNAVNSAVFPQSINIGSIQQMSISLSAGGVLSVTLNSSVRGSLTPAALASGFAALATTSMEASFDTIIVTQP